jgi:hypothetical protein
MHADWVRFIREGDVPWQAASAGSTPARRYTNDGPLDGTDAYRLEVELLALGASRTHSL